MWIWYQIWHQIHRRVAFGRPVRFWKGPVFEYFCYSTESLRGEAHHNSLVGRSGVCAAALPPRKCMELTQIGNGRYGKGNRIVEGPQISSCLCAKHL